MLLWSENFLTRPICKFFSLVCDLQKPSHLIRLKYSSLHPLFTRKSEIFLVLMLLLAQNCLCCLHIYFYFIWKFKNSFTKALCTYQSIQFLLMMILHLKSNFCICILHKCIWIFYPNLCLNQPFKKRNIIWVLIS